MSTETMRTIRDGEPKKAGSTLTQLLNSAHTKGPFKFSVALHPQRTTIKSVRDREPRTVTSTLTQLLNSVTSNIFLLADLHFV